jgi:F-box and leucine-rich repeat protein 1 (S-phase kinase-associated protein 2)
MLSRLTTLIAIDLFNIIKNNKSIKTLKTCIPSLVNVNQYPFSSIARPIIGFRRTSIWGNRLNDDAERGIVATIAKANDN